MASGRGRRLLSLPVLAVISLITFVYYSTIFVFLDELVGRHTSNGIFNSAVFSFVGLMCLVSFFAAVLIDPGRIPYSFAPEVEDPQKIGAQLKYCDRCSSYKPARAHHCRVCKRCVLKMDHHCLWINNCVGYRNYKPFVVFVLYATTASFYSLVIFVVNVTRNDHNLGVSHKLVYVLCGSLYVMLSMVLGTLLGWHIYLLCRNLTTIEYRGEVRAIWLAKKSGHTYRHPYDVGVQMNILSVLGPNILKWCWPVALGHLKDGVQFPVFHD